MQSRGTQLCRCFIFLKRPADLHDVVAAFEMKHDKGRRADGGGDKCATLGLALGEGGKQRGKWGGNGLRPSLAVNAG